MEEEARLYREEQRRIAASAKDRVTFMLANVLINQVTPSQISQSNTTLPSQISQSNPHQSGQYHRAHTIDIFILSTLLTQPFSISCRRTLCQSTLTTSPLNISYQPTHPPALTPSPHHQSNPTPLIISTGGI